MVNVVNVVVGIGVIVINLIPFIIKKPKYLFLTALLSLIILFLLANLK